MTTASDVLQLSDDEVVAISISAEAAWPGPLPTVDTDSTQVLRASALRGMRSLAVRRMLTESSTPSVALDPARAVLRGRRAVVTYLAPSPSSSPAAMPDPADGSAICSFFLLDGAVVAIDVTDTSGVHAIGVVPVTEACELLRDSVRQATAESRSESAAGLAWCMLVPTGDAHVTAVVVEAGDIALHQVGLEGQLEAVGSADPAGTLDSILADALVRAS